MRYRYVFMAGVGVGFVLGARAGRERYEQLAKLARKAADSPAVQQAAGAIHAQATGLATSARSKLAEQLPKLAGATRGRVDTVRNDRGAARVANGRTADDGQGPYRTAPGRRGETPA
jgi:hypothetical protein